MYVREHKIFGRVESLAQSHREKSPSYQPDQARGLVLDGLEYCHSMWWIAGTGSLDRRFPALCIDQ